MPISLALRGRHTDDAEARGAWAEAVAALRDVDRVFSTYRPDSFVSRLGRGEIDRRRTARPRWPRCSRSVSWPGCSRTAPSTYAGGGVLDPSGVVKGWAVERAARPLRGAARHRLLPVAPAATWCATSPAPGRRPGGSASRTRTTRPGCWPSCRSAPARSPPPASRTAGGHVVDARTGAVPDGDVAPRSPSSTTTWSGPTSTPPPPSPWAATPPAGSAPGPPHRPGRLGRRLDRGGGVDVPTPVEASRDGHPGTARTRSRMPTAPGRNPTASHHDATGFWWISRPTAAATTPNSPPMTHRPNRDPVALSSRKKAPITSPADRCRIVVTASTDSTQRCTWVNEWSLTSAPGCPGPSGAAAGGPGRGRSPLHRRASGTRSPCREA